MKGITSEEFEILPPVVRRKVRYKRLVCRSLIFANVSTIQYFSSLERLRLANETSVHSHCDALSRKQTTRPQLGRPRVHTVGKNGSRRLSKTSPSRQNSVSQADAQWFLNLPEKVKRRQFTEEERSYLTGKCATLIGDAADDAFYKRRQQSITESGTLPSFRSSLDTAEDKEILSGVDLDDDLDDPLQWLEEDDEFDLQTRLDNYRARIAAHDKLLNPPVRRRVRRPSIHQATVSLPRSLEHAVIEPQSRQGSVSSSIGNSTKIPLPSDNTSGDTKTQATYYRDPEARLKLRVYLASPQKFDEALEFGFPSTDNLSNIITKTETTKKDRQLSRLNTELSQSDMQTFLNDDDGEASLFFDDEESDDEEALSPTDTDVPLTPSEVTLDPPFRFAHHLPYPARLHSIASTGSTVASTLPRTFDSYSCAPPARAGREMTLRITLTRPDLDVRPKTSDANFEQTCIDPLTLEELTTPPKRKDGSRLRHDSVRLTGSDRGDDDGVTGGSINAGLMKKLLRKMSFKPASGKGGGGGNGGG